MGQNAKKGVRGTAARYKFVLQRRELTMPDGVRLAATVYLPKPKHKGETFPVLLEILPYRKEEAFHIVDYPTYSYCAQRGYITVKVDIRGTGSSQGQVPDREYSDIELADAEEIIAQLAAMPESNGNVAMWGVSWSGFNSLQVAMRQPLALKAIVAVHASDDLYHDDVHYIDGILHLDHYHLFINHELGLPRTPRYQLDSDYFKNRFNRKPWLLTFLNQQLDGHFWRRKSLREDYSRIKIPVYLIAGLLDGYRSAMVRTFENLESPVKLELGPWDHSCPDDGNPGPNYEYLDRMLTWLNHWLVKPNAATKRELAAGKQALVFVRSGHAPDAALETTPGSWRQQPWPVDSNPLKLYPLSGGKLGKRSGKAGKDELAYNAGVGVTAGSWWGDTTGDTALDDGRCLTYSSEPLTEPKAIIGFPQVMLLVDGSAKRANWSVRLEDVSPDGEVSLVTGAMLNSSQRDDRLAPRATTPGQPYEVAFDLHFTTWTFRAGHRIRLAVSNAQFPMAWPSPSLMRTLVHRGAQTHLTLPVVPIDGERPKLGKVKDKLSCPDGKDLEWKGKRLGVFKSWTHEQSESTTSYTWDTRSAYQVRQRKFFIEGRNHWVTRDKQPWYSQYRGTMSTTIEHGKSNIKLDTVIEVESDQHYFHVKVSRAVYKNGKLIRRRTWRELIQRQFQ
jgi:uncharacterized protein